MKTQDHTRVCPVERAGALDSSFRRFLQNPKKILGPFIRQGMTVVDLGCGPGFFTLEMARMLSGSGEVIAADLQQGMLDLVSLKISRAGLENMVKLHQCGEQSTGLSVKADFILAFYMIHEVPDQRRLFRELKTLLKSDGRLLIIEPNMHVNKSDFASMIEQLEQAGFKVTGRPGVFFSRSAILEHK